jgi:restriction system protein
MREDLLLALEPMTILIVLFGYTLYQLYDGYKLFRHRDLFMRKTTLKRLKALSWEQFEALSVELFKREGWHAKGNEKKGADGGVDVWIYRYRFPFRKERAIVQCKRYTTAMVGVKVVREMYGLLYEYHVDRVYIVTTSHFTKECYRFVKGKPIVLIDGEHLVEMING